MSMPKDFSEDGASGAIGGSAGTANLGNGTTGFNTSNGALAPNGFGGVFGGKQISDAQAEQQYGAGALAGGALNGFGGQFDQNPSTSDANSNGLNFMFDDGGVVPEQDPNDDGGQPADPNASMNGQVNDRIALALTSVDSALQYGRTKHGLPGDSGMDEGPGQQAAAMPMIPGNQSETPGPYKPQQPNPKMAAAMPTIPGNQSQTPGPYTPQQPQPGQQQAAAMPMIPGNQSETPGPYKPQQPQPQQMASNDDDGDDDTPTIPTEEETA